MDVLKKAGNICRAIRVELPKRVVPGTTLIEVAELIESRIRDGGALPAFPVNISIDDVAAHFTPKPRSDKKFEEGQIVKIDFGAHIDGWPVDNAMTIDLGEHDELKAAANEGLAAGTEVLLNRGPKATLSDIGKAIESAILARGFSPIVNLTGHKIDRWLLHGGFSIYNYDSGSKKEIGEGIFALEPFATTGSGRVKSGPASEIYRLVKPKRQRLPGPRAVLSEVTKFKTLPFCSRWVSKPEYLRLLSRDGSLHNYPLLVEVSGGIVSQAENTFLVKEGKVEQLT